MIGVSLVSIESTSCLSLVYMQRFLCVNFMAKYTKIMNYAVNVQRVSMSQLTDVLRVRFTVTGCLNISLCMLFLMN